MLYETGHAPISRRAGNKDNVRECLALRVKATAEEGDAFLAGMRLEDLGLLMAGASPRTCCLGMRRPYGQGIPGWCALPSW